MGRLERIKMSDKQEELKSLRELFSPISTNPPSCIILLPTAVAHFKLKPHVINAEFPWIRKKGSVYAHGRIFRHILDFLISKF